MINKKKGFTLIEVLISITLLSLVLMALYRSSDILRRSNKHLYEHLEKSTQSLNGNRILYMDLIQSDENITINNDKEFHRIMIKNTSHSLYGQSMAQVSWLVSKKDNTLLRIEGSRYILPLKEDMHVEIDPIVEHVELFKIYRNKKRDKLLILLQHNGRPVQSFMIQNRVIGKSQKEIDKESFKMVNPSELRNRNSRKKKEDKSIF